MNNLSVSYEGSKNNYLEKKAYDLAESYKGSVVSEFTYESGSFTANFKFNSAGQERNFQKDLQIASRSVNIELQFGGEISL